MNSILANCFVRRSVVAFAVPIATLLILLQSGLNAEPMLRIRWSLGPDLPQGFQDSDGGFIDGQLVTVGGFCSGGLEEDLI